MQTTLTPKPSDDPHDVVVVAPDAVRVAPAEEELSNLLQQAARYRSDTQTRAAPDAPAGPTVPPVETPTVPPVDTTFRPAAVDDLLVRGKRWSMVRRAARGFIGLLLAACIGLAAFAWRTWGDTIEKKFARWTTQVVMTASLQPENSGLPAQPPAPAVTADAANAQAPQPAAPAQSAAEAVAPQGVAPTAAPSPDQGQLLQSMSHDLASVGQEVEQLKASIAELKASQQQMSRDMAAKASEVKASEVKASEARVSGVRASEQNARPRTAALSPRPAPARPRKPTPPYPYPQQAAGAPRLPPVAAPYPAAPYPAAAPYYGPRQADYASRPIEPQPQVTADPPAEEPELSPGLRPPMPVR
jgi:hypothetical protein